MSLEGMDVDQAQRLARQFDGYAQALIHITAGLGAMAEQLSYHWHGPASGIFQQQWSTQYRGAISRAAQAMTDMHTHLVANIQQQVQASASDAGGGGAAGFGIGTVLSGVTLTALLGGVKAGYESYSAATSLLDLGRNANVVGDYTKKWHQVLDLANNSPFLKYKRSPFLHWLHDNPQLKTARELADKMPAHDFLDKSGKVLGLASGAEHMGKAYDAYNHHNYAAAGGETVEATASFLKTSKNPVAYLAGVDISLIHKDYDLASQVDWSHIPNPLDPGVFKNDYVPSFEQLPSEMASNLAGVF